MTRALRQFAAPTRIVAGRGWVEASLGDELRALGAGTVAVVADGGLAGARALDGELSRTPPRRPMVAAALDAPPALDAAERALVARPDAAQDQPPALGVAARRPNRRAPLTADR